MFVPPRCPYRHCPNHAEPTRDFFRRRGSYRAKCRPHRIPRFECRACGRSFSRQTFRMDYRDHRPDLNQALFWSFVCGTGIRQTARRLGLSVRCTELKLRKIARHLRRLNVNLRGPLQEGAVLLLDELESYEGRRNTRPVSIPILVEGTSRFLIWAESAPIRPRGKMTKARLRAIESDEKRYGRRVDGSRSALRRTLARGAALAGGLERVLLLTDEKSTYPALAAEAFGAERLDHETTSSKLARGVWNALFPINHTEAMARDLTGRLRRESWLVSKKRRFLDLGLQLYAAYRNYARSRFNRDRVTPAQLLGFVERPLLFGELLGWRQDWGERSPHPASERGERCVPAAA